MKRATVILIILGVALAGVAGSGCQENEGATKACKGASASSDDCSECCQKNGANGHKYINGDCSCLGG